MYYRLILYIIFGVLPSLIWLFYYLKKDLHPEPKKMIIKVFLCGMAATIPTFFVEVGLLELLSSQFISPFMAYLPAVAEFLKWFVIIALTEEVFKYLAVRLAIFRSGELDEPLDIMLYMVVGALGFATLENVLYLFSPINSAISFNEIVRTTISGSFIRFIGGTLLHTLTSGMVGYFMALSSVKNGKGKKFTAFGIFLAALLHGLYNFSIIRMSDPFDFIVPAAVIVGLTAFMFYDFDEIKKVKSICKI